MTYTYSTTKNNGQITSSYDAITGETITYQYDALKRLLSASSNKHWGETYTYDGYGNMTQMAPTGTAGAPSLSVTVDYTTNRLTASGAQYDNNGNLGLGFGGIEFGHDMANRLSQVQINSQSSYYIYDSDNRRVYYRDVNNNETIYFYGADGKKLATYTYSIVTNQMTGGNPEIQLTQQSENVYFLGKLINAEGNGVTTDRLGSVRNGGGAGYQAQYPYGVEYTTTVNDREKYATYTRDSLTGLDYAMNRYYSSQWGRFLSPDPYGGSVRLRDPQTWNRYRYVNNDPINAYDPTGLNQQLLICGYASGETEEGTVWKEACLEGAWSGGGGVLGNSAGPSLSASVRSQLKNALRSLGPGCAGVFGATNLTAATPQGTLGGPQISLLTALSDTGGLNFFSVTAQGNMTLGQLGIVDPSSGMPYGGDPTLATYFGDPSKIVAATLNNNILLGPLFFGETFGQQAIALIHEDLHSVFNGTTIGGTDVDVANYFGLSYDRSLSGDQLVAAASRAISAWLGSDCGGNQ